MKTWLLALLLLCGCTAITSYVPAVLPARPGPYIVDARSNTSELVAVVDGKRYSMARISEDLWSATVELRDGSRVSFEAGPHTTKPQSVKLVSTLVQ